ncbi:MAG: hypothetical protein JWM47_4557 [Acidimicrobiales bacterium]|nr:hypothetical protein [Acidimicrobiales bacterium]
MALRRYHSIDAFNCIDQIVMAESKWRHRINYGGYEGPYQGRAYGIPQALPGSKMSSAGADWETNPRTQIRWMFDYVDAGYGGPCGAAAARFGRGWY